MKTKSLKKTKGIIVFLEIIIAALGVLVVASGFMWYAKSLQDAYLALGTKVIQISDQIDLYNVCPGKMCYAMGPAGGAGDGGYGFLGGNYQISGSSIATTGSSFLGASIGGGTDFNGNSHIAGGLGGFLGGAGSVTQSSYFFSNAPLK